MCAWVRACVCVCVRVCKCESVCERVRVCVCWGGKSPKDDATCFMKKINGSRENGRQCFEKVEEERESVCV